jgi:hypothetical protein
VRHAKSEAMFPIWTTLSLPLSPLSIHHTISHSTAVFQVVILNMWSLGFDYWLLLHFSINISLYLWKRRYLVPKYSTTGQFLVVHFQRTEIELHKKQEVLGRTSRLLSLIRHRPHWKRRAQQFFYCCVCIRYRGNVSTEPLTSNDRGIFTEQLPSNNKGIFIWPLPSNDKGTYTEPLPRTDAEDMQTHTNTHTYTATWSHKPTFIFSK